jgi:hypothetical protein
MAGFGLHVFNIGNLAQTILYYVSLGIKGSYEEPKKDPNIIDRHKLYINGILGP